MSEQLKQLNPKKIIELGNGYASTAVNVCTFRYHAVVTSSPYQFAAYYESSTRIIVVRRDLRTDDLVFGFIAGTFQVRDVHIGRKLAVQRLAPPAYTPPGDLYILWDDEVNFCEPVADLHRWRQDGTLSLLVQAAEQPELCADREAEPTPVRLVDWAVDEAE